MAKYIEKIGAVAYDNLIADTHVKQIVASGTIAANGGEFKRGTVMALADGKLVAMASGKTPYGILCDDVTVGATDEVVEVYLTGKFNKAALHVAAGYTLTAADIQTLRNGGIFVENVVE